MQSIIASLSKVRESVAQGALQVSRNPESVKILAVSKGQPWEVIREACDAGVDAFGENYLKEALPKIARAQAEGYQINWHFIGRIQSNKVKTIAQRFACVHSVASVHIAQLLNQYRVNLAALPILLQVNLSEQSNKAGVLLQDLPAVVECSQSLPRLKLKGLMTMTEPEMTDEQKRLIFAHTRQLLQNLNKDYQLHMDTLSMGMSDDYLAAIAEGATIVRIGRAIFGERQY